MNRSPRQPLLTGYRNLFRIHTIAVVARAVSARGLWLALVVCSTAWAAIGCPALRAAASETRPNFVIFLADDLGYGDLGCYGNRVIQTPNLDRFAQQGMRFTQCYSASSVCSPSRSAILTGRTPYRNGVFTWLPEGDTVHLRRSEIALPRLLKQRGYQTCHVGKWHLNGKFNSPEQPQPNDHGYDWWLATQNNAAPSHKNPENFVRNGQPLGRLEGFSAQLVAQEAVEWLERHRDPQKPFFLAVWTHEPHLPIETDPRFMQPYAAFDDEGIRQHHGNVTQMDHAFGTVIDALDRLHLSDNTFIMFTSDNGPEGDGTKGRTRGSTGGLRGRKRDVYEGGIRVPGIIRWPGHIPPASTSEQPIVGSDFFTTVCDILDIPLPDDRTIDGASLLPAFEGRPIQRRVPMYWRYYRAPHGVQIAMRQGDWKIVAPEDLSRFELYNIARDPREQHELSANEPEKLAEMKRTLLKLNAEIEAEGPDWWKNYQPPRRKKRPAKPRAGASPRANK